MRERGYTDIVLWKRLLQQARPYWVHITGVILLGLLATPLALLTPVSLKIVVDSVLGSDPVPGFIAVILPESIQNSGFGLLVFAAALQVGVVVFTQLQALGNHVLSTYAGENLTLRFRTRLFHHLQRLSFSFLDMRGTADSLYRVQYDAPSIQQLIVQGLIPLITAVVTALAMIYVTLRINWQLALVALAAAPLMFVFSWLYRTRMRPRYTRVRKLESHALNVVQEVLGALRVVKAFGGEDRERERFVRQSHESVQARIKISFAEGLLGLLVNLVAAVGTAAVLLIGVLQIQAGRLTLGELLVVITYLAQLYAPMKTISNKTTVLQSALAGAERAFELIDETPDVVERPDAKPLDRARGSIAFERVAFRYSTGGPVFEDLSFTISPGTRVGIAGPTGAGKTTLVSLITRFYDPTEGRILLDGVDLRDYVLNDLRNQFAIVPQEPILFSTSIAENIAYADPGAGEAAIVKAAQAAAIHTFIDQLPDGYDTQVGERGLRLSGGERQRIALARAFLKDAPLLILDEPTSSVDIRTEADIMATMEQLMVGRTTFMIAHRLSTLDNCDLILVIDQGRLRRMASDTATVRDLLSSLDSTSSPSSLSYN